MTDERKQELVEEREVIKRKVFVCPTDPSELSQCDSCQ